jgi:hypothetical protein
MFAQMSQNFHQTTGCHIPEAKFISKTLSASSYPPYAHPDILYQKRKHILSLFYNCLPDKCQLDTFAVGGNSLCKLRLILCPLLLSLNVCCYHDQTVPDRVGPRPVFPDIHNPSNMTFHWWIICVSCFSFSKGACIWRVAILGNSIEA